MLPVLLTLLIGCDGSPDSTAVSVEPTEAGAPAESTSEPQNQGAPLFGDAVVDESVTGKWARSCALCHVTGEGGAPRLGNRSEWQARLAQGEQGLLTHTIEGFNNMPPLGYCMGCEMEDLRAMIKLMIGEES